MGEWFEGKLADVCASVDYGLTASASDIPVGPKFLRITDIVGSSFDWAHVPFVPATGKDTEKYKLYSGDIVIARTGATTGESRYIIDPPNAVFASYLVRLKINDKNDPRFIGYWLKSPAFKNYLQGVLGDKSAQPNASASTMANAPIRIPATRGEQVRISAILGLLDDKIEANRRMNATLEAMAQAIFRDWFVDFGPTHRKQEGATDPVQIMGGVTQNAEDAARLADLFPDAFGNDGLPQVWEMGTLSDLVELNPKEPLKKGTVAPYTDMASLPTAGPTTAAPLLRAFSSGMRFRNGDALIARITPCLENGKSAYVDFLPDDKSVGWGSTEFIVLRSKPPVPSPFAYLIVRHPEFRERAIQSMTGTSGRQRAQADTLANFRISKARPEVYSGFADIIRPMFEMIRANAIQNQTLAETRDLLLPRLMSGEISFKDAEAAA